jgi:hypothetical protein
MATAPSVFADLDLGGLGTLIVNSGASPALTAGFLVVGVGFAGLEVWRERRSSLAAQGMRGHYANRDVHHTEHHYHYAPSTEPQERAPVNALVPASAPSVPASRATPSIFAKGPSRAEDDSEAAGTTELRRALDTALQECTPSQFESVLHHAGWDSSSKISPAPIRAQDAVRHATGHAGGLENLRHALFLVEPHLLPEDERELASLRARVRACLKRGNDRDDGRESRDDEDAPA